MFHGVVKVVLNCDAGHIVSHRVVKVVLNCDAGNIVFHGPREDVVEFFESCGFQCPERKGVPDFLQEVTSVNDQKVGLFAIAKLQDHCTHASCLQVRFASLLCMSNSLSLAHTRF